jgi:hypothetical protein
LFVIQPTLNQAKHTKVRSMGLLGQKDFKKYFLKPNNPLKNYFRNKRLENVDDEILHQRLKE